MRDRTAVFSEKLNIVVIFGGQTYEHSASVLSALNIVEKLDKKKYHIFALYIDKAGNWHFFNHVDIKKTSSFVNKCSIDILYYDAVKTNKAICAFLEQKVDVAFPIIHGPIGEDGAIQGFLETVGIPYVGSDVQSSAMCMDKEASRLIAKSHGINCVPFFKIDFTKESVDIDNTIKKVIHEFGFPLFTKPASAGSSIGVAKHEDFGFLETSLSVALKLSNKVLIEKAINCKEIEVGVLENIESYENPKISMPGEVKSAREFYDYEAKYLMKEGAVLDVPALNLSDKLCEALREMSAKIFKALNCKGLARVDFFIEKETNNIYFNEINTLPGFTDISLYPRLMKTIGITYTKLLDSLIKLALKNGTVAFRKKNFYIDVLDAIEQSRRRD